jgi:5'-nucleotidase
VNYGEIFAAQPFRNQLVTLTLTGAQIKAALEQQWLDPARPRILQVSRDFSYVWDNAAPPGSRVLPDRIRLNGQPLDPQANYRVTVNGFLAVGGDGFTALQDGVAARFGVYDVDALHAYFKAKSPIAPGTVDRIMRLH